MKLRKLEEKDCKGMIEWMHDKSVVRDLSANFPNKTEGDALAYIRNSLEDENNLHLAIADENDEYLGTVSLKNIDRENSEAEFAIAIRKKAMGKGVSKAAMQKILDIGFNEFDLKCIYWYVSKKNERALRFYDKNGYNRDDDPKMNTSAGSNPEQFIWYSIYK